MTRKPYIWTREHARERLGNIWHLRYHWQDMFDEPGDRGHYTRFQWLGKRFHDLRNVQAFDAVWNGSPCKLHVRIVTSRAWFCREVYLRALARTRQRYPGFDAHCYHDGKRIGERLLEFTSETYDLAASHLWTSLWKVIEDEPPTITESLTEAACNPAGHAPAVAATVRHWHKEGGDHRRLTLIRHADKITDDDCKLFQQQLSRGEQPVLDESPKRWTFKDIQDDFVELSAPELAALNRAESRKPMTEADRALHNAVESLDGVALSATLSQGADVNSVDDDECSALTNLVEAWSEHHWRVAATDDELKNSGWSGRPARTIDLSEVLAMMDTLFAAGAHPDVHGPEEVTAITRAALCREVELGEKLLAHGADAALCTSFDNSRSEWPQTWDSPYYDYHYEQNERAKQFCELLERTRPSPYYTPDS